MRALVLLLCAATALSAQIIPFRTNLEIWKRIASYLELTSGQLDAILAINGPHWAMADELERSRLVLREAIFTETARSPLRPAELGRLHVDWEMGRRRLLDAERTSNEATRKLLTETQLARLKLLEDLTATRPAMDEAISIGLSPADCVKTAANYLPDSCSPHIFPLFNDIVSWRPRPSDYEAATPGTIGIADPLQAHFRFTEAQQAAMRANAERANSFSQIPRMRVVIDEITEELKRSTLDPMAIGLRFAEIESNRRQMSEAEERLADANIALLDPAQKAKHAALVEAQRLAPLIESAVRYPILKSRCLDAVVFLFGFHLEETPFGYSLFRTYLGECPDRRSLLELP